MTNIPDWSKVFAQTEEPIETQTDKFHSIGETSEEMIAKRLRELAAMTPHDRCEMAMRRLLRQLKVLGNDNWYAAIEVALAAAGIMMLRDEPVILSRWSKEDEEACQ